LEPALKRKKSGMARVVGIHGIAQELETREPYEICDSASPLEAGASRKPPRSRIAVRHARSFE
jgi:hypothetical protein